MRNTAASKVVDLSSLLSLCEAHRQAGRVVVWTNGCFDLFHAGHARSLHAASLLGDVLVVGVNSDESVRRLKGPLRPVIGEDERAELVAALGCVDHVVVFADALPTRVLEVLRPDVHCKGADYAPPHGKPIPEQAVVEAYGGRVEFLPLVEGISTSELIRRVRTLEAGATPGSRA
jgi:D-beta-D-heptose 7-phosphate kinase/D-beta-D-heptose 1-phosphate adenosyltransferase